MAGGTKKSTIRLSVCALLCALGVVMLSIGSLFETLDLSAAALAAMLVVFVIIEIGGVWSWLLYAATGTLALLLPARGAAVFYLAFAGYYPILKEKIEKIRNRPLRWVIKLVVFNAALAVIIFVLKYVTMISQTVLDPTAVLFLLGNAAFILFDIALTRLISLYIIKLRRRLKIGNLKLK